MSSSTIGPFTKESDNPSEKVIKKVGVWMIPKRHWSLLLTRLPKKVILAWLTKKGGKSNVLKEAITPPILETNKIDTFNKTKKSQASNKIVDSPKINKTGKVKSINK